MDKNINDSKEVYNGYIHTCGIISVYKLTYHGIRLHIYHSYNIQLYLYI